MFIASAVYEQKNFGLTRLKICTASEAALSSRETNLDAKEICYHCDHELAQIIMKLAATKKLPVQFNFRGDSCTLISYACNDKEREFNKYRINYIAETKQLAYLDEIVVYHKRCNCPKCFSQYGWDSIENICGSVSTVGGSKVKIDLQRCKYCRTYFIDRQSLKAYELKYGQLRIQHCTMEEFIRRSTPMQNIDGFAPDSILSRNGYLTKYTERQRRNALRMMIYNGISKAEIKNKLAEFIELRGERCYMAVNIWIDDLEYVNDYNLEREEQVLFIDRDAVQR